MSLADPQSITISGSTSSLPKTNVSGMSSEYTSSDGLIKLSFSHQALKNGRWRRMARVDHAKITADPFIPAQNVRTSLSIYTVFDIPPAGYTSAEVKAVFDGFRTQLAASTDADVTKLLGGES